MANKILILGQSGTGKSTSIRNLNPEETYIIQVVKKDLPFRGWKNKYKKDIVEDKKIIEEGNLAISSTSDSVVGYLKAISLKREYIKTIIIDDFQYIMSYEFMRRAYEKGYEKFTEIGKHAFDVLESIDALRDDLTVIILSHIEMDQFGNEKMKTVGKLLDSAITPEGLFSITLKTVCIDGNYYFETQSNGSNTMKSPMEMFDDREPNDLKVILEKIEEYNN